MSLLSEHQTPADLGDRLRNAGDVTAEFLSDIIRATCRRLPSANQNARAARVERLIQSQAWTDAALALIDLELPQWQVRRLAYDDGEWYCALSRQRELPDWLDQSIETHHADLALAILSAFVEAQRVSAPLEPDQRSAPCRATPIRSTSRSAATISREGGEILPSGYALCRKSAARRLRSAAGPDPDFGRPTCSSWSPSQGSAASASNQKPDGAVVDGHGPLRRHRRHAARAGLFDAELNHWDEIGGLPATMRAASARSS